MNLNWFRSVVPTLEKAPIPNKQNARAFHHPRRTPRSQKPFLFLCLIFGSSLLCAAGDTTSQMVREAGGGKMTTTPVLKSGSTPGQTTPLSLLPQGLQPTQAYSHGDPTPDEQLMLQLINRARANHLRS